MVLPVFTDPLRMSWVVVFVENVSDYCRTPPFKMSRCSLTRELFHCRGVKHLRRKSYLFRRRTNVRSAFGIECVGRWKETRGRMEAEEDETRGTLCFPRSCQESERPLVPDRALHCSCSLPAAIVVMSTKLILCIDSLGCNTAFIMKWERQAVTFSASNVLYWYVWVVVLQNVCVLQTVSHEMKPRTPHCNGQNLCLWLEWHPWWGQEHGRKRRRRRVHRPFDDVTLTQLMCSF